jgi:hypothetical protein
MSAIIPSITFWALYLLNAGAATPKVLLPNAFIVHDLALVDGWRTLLDIREFDAHWARHGLAELAAAHSGCRRVKKAKGQR